MDSARRRHFEARQRLKRLTQSVELMKSDILKNEAQLEAMSQMGDFLRQIAPGGANPMRYFVTAETLISEFDRLEQSNLRIYEYLMHYQQLFNQSTSCFQEKMAQNDAVTAVMNEKFAGLRAVAEEKTVAPTSDFQDTELARLGALISRAYKLCIGKDADLLPLLQLERIEVQFDAMCEQLERISPEFIRERQLIRDKERREQQRLDRQEKRAQDGKHKSDSPRPTSLCARSHREGKSRDGGTRKYNVT
jgi:hypothetical protein